MASATLVKVEELSDGDFRITAEHMALFKRLICTPGAIENLIAYANRLPTMDVCVTRVDTAVTRIDQRCGAVELVCQNYICPGQVLYSQRTLDEYSDDNQINMTEVVKGLGGNYVDQFPVAPGKQIKLTHKARPGFCPKKIAVDLNLAGNGSNYLDFVLQFYLVPGGTNNAEGLPLGPEMRGNQFLNKDGTQIHVPFPEYRNQPIDIGSLEQLALVIKHSGNANNLDSAFVTVYYDNRQFYELCRKKACSNGC